MKKVLFTTMSIIAVAAMMLVSCKKDNGDDNKGKDDNKPVDEYTGPVEGTSAWSVVGTLLESDWGGGAHGDYVMAEASEGIFVLKNVKLAATDEFKFRENKGWDNAYRGDFAAIGEAFDVDNTPGAPNIKPELDGIYDLYLNVAVAQAAIVAKDGAEPTWKEVVPEPITIDDSVEDWTAEGVETFAGINNRIVEWKATSSANYIYFYYKVTKEKIKTDGSSSFYVGFNTDNDASSGSQAEHGAAGNSAGLEVLAYFYPWNAAADGIAAGADASSYVQNPVGTAVDGAKVTVGGKIDGDFAYVEVSIPRAAVGTFAADSKITVKHAMQYYPTNAEQITLK